MAERKAKPGTYIINWLLMKMRKVFVRHFWMHPSIQPIQMLSRLNMQCMCQKCQNPMPVCLKIFSKLWYSNQFCQNSCVCVNINKEYDIDNHL